MTAMPVDLGKILCPNQAGCVQTSNRKTSSDRQCRALIQDPFTKRQTGPRCSRRKVFDDEKPQANKTRDDLVADELCRQHKHMKEKFAEMIVQQLLEEQQGESTAAITTTNSSAILTSSMPSGPYRPRSDPFQSTQSAVPVATISNQVTSMANTEDHTTPPSQGGLIQDCLRIIDEHRTDLIHRGPDNRTETDKDRLVEDLANTLAVMLMDDSDEASDGGEEVTSGRENTRTEEEELWDQIT